jgi:hypothetical protein
VDLTSKISLTFNKILTSHTPLFQHPHDLTKHLKLFNSIVVDTEEFLKFINDTVLNRPCVECHKNTVYLEVF